MIDRTILTLASHTDIIALHQYQKILSDLLDSSLHDYTDQNIPYGDALQTSMFGLFGLLADNENLKDSAVKQSRKMQTKFNQIDNTESKISEIKPMIMRLDYGKTLSAIRQLTMLGLYDALAYIENR